MSEERQTNEAPQAGQTAGAQTAPQAEPAAGQTINPETDAAAAEQPTCGTSPAPEASADQDSAREAAPEAAREPERRDWFGQKAREAEALKAKLDAAEKKAGDARDQLLRTAAEYENFRKRSAREADQKFNDGISHAVTQILGILDTLDMAADAPCTDENYKKGVVMTLEKADKALQKLNITEIEAEGKPFDPNLMNAVQQVPAEEGQESGTVVRVFQKGYRIGDKIIRHATVVVAE